MNDLNFETEVSAIKDKLLYFAYKLYNDPEEAINLLNETIQKALECKDEFKPDMNFAGWMYTMMRNIFINNYRKQIRNSFIIDEVKRRTNYCRPNLTKNDILIGSKKTGTHLQVVGGRLFNPTL